MPSRWFRITYAEKTFRRFLDGRGTALPGLRVPEATTLVLAFYREFRAQHARITDQGDGLLWQWGPDADAERFTVDLTRQLVREGDNEPIVQLSVTLAYRWTPARRALGRGHAWCFSPPASIEFEKSLRASAAYRAIQTAIPAAIFLHTETL